MFAVGSANPIPIDYNGQKCSIVGDTESLMWYCIGFIWENTMCCSPQAVASQYASFSDNDSLKHSQPLQPLSCANTSFYEVGLLAEKMNQCRSKMPQRKKTPYFQASHRWQCSSAKSCVSSAVPGGGVRAHTRAAGAGMHTTNFLLFRSGYCKTGDVKVA